MEMLYDISTIVQTMAIGLGVGTSTLAITSYFVALANGGGMDTSERRMMQPIYVVLRIAMVLILVTVILEGLALFLSYGAGIFGGSAFSAWTVVAVLFINAVLMTKHIMPMSLGPAIQASTWYSLGFLSSLFAIGNQNFSYLTFLIYYVLFMIAVIILVNAITFYLKRNSGGDIPQSQG